MDHLCAILAALRFPVGQHTSSRRQAVFHRRVKIEKAHGKNAGTVANLAGHHPTTAESDIAVQHFTFNGGVDARQQFANRVEMGTVFVTQREVEQEVLHGMQANFRQFTALRCADACQGIERNSV